MFGNNHGSYGPPSSSNGAQSESRNLLSLADSAYSRGELSQAAHLYLAACDAEGSISGSAKEGFVTGLKNAWEASCKLKERALAEHVFEKLEPFLSAEEIAEHTEELQHLALDKLEEFGFTREDLQDMADMVAEDFASAIRTGDSPEAVFTQFFALENSDNKAVAGVLPAPSKTGEIQTSSEESKTLKQKNPDEYRYSDLIGFNRAIASMNKMGIGLSADQNFSNFLEALSKRHGIERLPSFETLLFQSYSREDANQFMLATAQELNVAGVRMYMEDTPMGFPVLCVVATSNFKFNPLKGGFEGSGMLVLEDIDLWGAPFSSMPEEYENTPASAYATRGVRDAIMFIRSAVENPDVYVLATCAKDAVLDEFFEELLDPISLIEVDVPDEDERIAVWQDIFSLYPSLKPLANNELVRLSANMSRNDIYLAAREAVEQAFRASIEKRSYIPVTHDNLYNKIAAYQPLESEEYKEIEQRAIESLRNDLSSVEGTEKGIN